VARFAAAKPYLTGPPDAQRRALLAQMRGLKCHVPK
jgi:hypothetical protein